MTNKLSEYMIVSILYLISENVIHSKITFSDISNLFQKVDEYLIYNKRDELNKIYLNISKNLKELQNKEFNKDILGNISNNHYKIENNFFHYSFISYTDSKKCKNVFNLS